MADSITRCPKCHTSFRITQAHLSSAKGAVRCGSCLNIFNAKEHLIETIEPAPARKPAKPSKPTKPLTNKPKTPAKPVTRPAAKATSPVAPKPVPKPVPAAQRTREEDDFLISDDMDISDPHDHKEDQFNTDQQDNIIYSKTLAPTNSNLFERSDDEKDDDDENRPDESWALNLLDDGDGSELPKLMKDTGQHVAVSDVRAESGLYPATPDNSQEDPEEAEAQAFIKENYPELPPERVEEELRQSAFHEPVFTAIEPTIDELESDYDPGRSGRQPLIHAIEPEPVEFSYARSFSLRESNWLWMPLTIAMALTLVGLVGWLQFDRYSRIEPYRGYYGQACALIGCELPSLISRKDIRAVNLVVRSHPRAKNALIVDAVLQNTAEFDQPFPSLDLIFTDAGDKPIAARRFSPNEYLAGEMAGKTQMPSRKPVHIALEIIDPGSEAVGYRIEIAN